MFVLPAALTQDKTLSSSLKNFLKSLASLCGDKAYCWPGRKYLADDLSLSVRSVSRLTAEAVDRGLITIRRRFRHSSIFTMLCLEERKPKAEKTSNIGFVPWPALRTDHPKEQTFEPFFPKDLSEDQRERVTDIERVTGDHKSRGCFVKLVKEASEGEILVGLSSVKHAIATQSGVHASRYFMGVMRNLRGSQPVNPSLVQPPVDQPMKPFFAANEPLPARCDHSESLDRIAELKRILRM